MISFVKLASLTETMFTLLHRFSPLCVGLSPLKNTDQAQILRLCSKTLHYRSCSSSKYLRTESVKQSLSGFVSTRCLFSSCHRNFYSRDPSALTAKSSQNFPPLKSCLRRQLHRSPSLWSEEVPKEEPARGGIDENIFTIPNMLTSTRIALTPYIGYLVLQQDFNLACSLFVFAGLTDMLDGWIARKFPSQTSALGSFLDPLADKFLVTILYFTLTMAHLIPAPLTFIVIARDVLLVGAASYVRYISLPKPITLTSYFNASRATVELQPMLISKINTALQLSLVAFTLAAPVVGFVDHWALQALWCTTALTTVSSGVGYAIYKNDTFKMIQSAHKKAKTKKS